MTEAVINTKRQETWKEMCQQDIDKHLIELIKICEEGLGDVDNIDLAELDYNNTFLKMAIGNMAIIEIVEGED